MEVDGEISPSILDREMSPSILDREMSPSILDREMSPSILDREMSPSIPPSIPPLVPDEEIPSLVPAVSPITDTLTRVPVTILTGFLGAGKSTLLGRILKERHGWKVAVILNELGPTSSVDRALLWEKNDRVGEEWLEVENGCLCCTAKNETFLAVEGLLKRRPDIEHVIIEASGAADPSALVQKLWIDEALESRVFLDSVTCVVDSSTAMRMFAPTSLHYAVEAARQVALSDCILLNKVDLVGEDEMLAVEGIIKEINPIGKIIRTQFSDAPLEVILQMGQYDSGPSKAHDVIGNLLEQVMRISIHSHSPAVIRSFNVYLKHPIELGSFEYWLFPLLWERKVGQYSLQEDEIILRVKGIVLLKGDRGNVLPYALQAVQDKYELEPLHRWERVQESTIIFIGRIDPTTEIIIKESIQKLLSG